MEANNNSKRQTYYHINGMKGIACLAILIGHYLGIYNFAESFTPSIHIMDVIYNSPASFIISPGHWLYLFFVVSGYLVSKSKISNVKELFAKIVNRFLRLGFPVLFSYCIIFIIYKLVGFHNSETVSLFQCAWYQDFYSREFSIIDVLISPFSVLLFESIEMNAPYWVLRMMLISSVIIYVLGLVFSKVKLLQRDGFDCLVLIIIMLLTSAAFPIISAHLIGMLASRYEKQPIRIKSVYFAGLVIVAASAVFLPSKIIIAIFFAALILLLPKIGIINRILCGKVCQFIASISWGIFSYHWPLACSVGAVWLLYGSGQIGLLGAYFTGFFINLILTFAISWCSAQTLEKLASSLTRKIYVALLRQMKVSN